MIMIMPIADSEEDGDGNHYYDDEDFDYHDNYGNRAKEVKFTFLQ